MASNSGSKKPAGNKKSSSQKAAEKQLKKLNLGVKIVIALVVFVALAISVVFFERPINTMLGLYSLDESTVTAGSADSVVSIDGVLTVHFIDVGQGDCILIDLPSGDDEPKLMLIDGGTDKDKQKAITYIDEYYPELSGAEQYFEYVILTHPDEDHCGGIDDLITKYGAKYMYRPNVRATKSYTDPGLSASGIGKLTGEAVSGKGVKDTWAYRNAIEAMYKQSISGAEVIVNAAIRDAAGLQKSIEILDGNSDGDYLDTVDCRLTFWGPVSSFYTNVNDYSPIMTIEYLGKTILLTGDSEAEGEAQFVKYIKDNGIDFPECDIIKFGHHGSETSTSKDLLELAAPTARQNVFGIISCGLDNKYGHPRQKVLDRWTEMGFSSEYIKRTDLDSTIVLSIKKVTESGEYVIMNGTTMIRTVDEKPVRWLYIAISVFIVVVVVLFVSGTDWKKEAKKAGKSSSKKK